MTTDNDLIALVRTYNPRTHEKLIRDAFVFGAQMHEGQFRHSGEPYFTHPVAVATILAEMQMDDATLITALKTALGEEVQDVAKSNRLTSSPVCIVAGNQGFDRTLEKYLARQEGKTSISAPVLEINPEHALIAKLAERAGKGEDMGEAAKLLLDQAVILEGEVPADASGFAERLSKLMQQVYD